jgi:hypothetical protein
MKSKQNLPNGSFKGTRQWGRRRFSGNILMVDEEKGEQAGEDEEEEGGGDESSKIRYEDVLNGPLGMTLLGTGRRGSLIREGVD